MPTATAHSSFTRRGIAPAIFAVASIFFCAFLFPSLLQATHFRGGNMFATIDSTGAVTVTVETLWRKGAEPFPFGGLDPGRFSMNSFICPLDGMPYPVVNPTGMRIRQAGGPVIYNFTGSEFTLPGTTTFTDTSDPEFDRRVQTLVIPIGPAPHPNQVIPPLGQPFGLYEIDWNDYFYTPGLQNLEPGVPCPSDNKSYGFRVRVNFDGSDNGTPRLRGIPLSPVVRGMVLQAYAGASDPDGDSFFYRLPAGNAQSPQYGPLTPLPGARLRSDGELVMDSSATSALLENSFGDPDGDYLLSIEVEDSRGSIAVRHLLLDAVTTSNNPPVLDPIGDRILVVGEPVNFEVRATDTDAGDVITLRAVPPPGMTILLPPETLDTSPARTTYSWVPQPADAGKVFDVVVYAIDGSSNLRDDVVVRFSVEPPTFNPVLEEIENKRVGADPLNLVPFVPDILNFDALAIDPNSDPLTYSAPIFVDPSGQNQPGRITVTPGIDGFGNPIGTYTFNPTPADVGVWDLRVRVDDIGGGRDEQVVTISVGTFTNQSPVFDLAPPADTPLIEGSTLGVTVQAHDDVAVERVELRTRGRPFESSFPEGVTAGPGNPTSGNFTWTPTGRDVGIFTMDFRATDDGSPVIEERVGTTIHVLEDDPPEVTFYAEKATGTDSPCNSSRENDPNFPFITIQGAFDCLMTLHIGETAGGPYRIQILDSATYPETLLIEDPTGTTSFSNLVIGAARGARPVIDGGSVRPTGVDVRMDNVTLDGLTLRNFQAPHYGNAIQIDGNSNLTVRNCVLDPQSDFGILIGFRHSGAVFLPSNDIHIRNNVLLNAVHQGTDLDNQGDAIHIMSGATNLVIENNSFYNYASDAIYFMPEPAGAAATNTNIRNNIFHPTVATSTAISVADADAQPTTTSDYNEFYLSLSGNPVSANAGFWDGSHRATLADWIGSSGLDGFSADANPLFVNPGVDFHLQSTFGSFDPSSGIFVPQGGDSPGIDTGDPISDFSEERENSGGRINKGAYGNTPEASLSGGCADSDGDGFFACIDDCDDFDASTCPNPGLCPDVCDGRDNDCNSLVDDDFNACDDGDFCNGFEFCNAGVCDPGSVGAGEAPNGDTVPGTPVTVAYNDTTGEVTLSWGASCNACDADYAVYAVTSLGFLDPAAMTPVTCSTGGTTSWTFVDPNPLCMYVVIPLSGGVIIVEGSPGTDSVGGLRPQSLSACAPRSLSSCFGTPGQTCSNPFECQNLLCVDSFCCDSACTDACSSCDQPGLEGICSAVPSGSGPPETCNGIDDNCDGTVDDGFGVGGGCTGTGACGAGVIECDGGGGTRCSTDPGGSQDESELEICNGIDEDCDGLTDEDFPALGGSCVGIGECGPGLRECGPTGLEICSTDPGGTQDQSAPEICDSLDDDCDGDTDEGFDVGLPCLGAGTCGEGVRECDGGGGGRCSVDPGGTQDASAPESCDGLDNDCDGSTDEGCSCQSGSTQPCGTSVGECSTGTQTCSSSQWQLCDAIDPAPELCDGLDNDCDGLTDDDPFDVGMPCVGVGVCGGGTIECAGSSGAICSTFPGGSEDQSAMEACGDGLDNDCDGSVDEGCSCSPGATQPCGSSTGTCSTATQACLPGGLWDFCADTGPAVEVCDTLDNDCDGIADDNISTDCGVGACNSTGVCSGGIDTCTPGPPTSETCDGIDNDCDGLTDNGFALGGACDGVGECGAGTVECRLPFATGCSSDVGGSRDQSLPESCDGLDNDCDGDTDEAAGCFLPGQTCTLASDCASGFCTDGVCCDAACIGTCESCDQAGSEGTCTLHAFPTDPEDECGGFFCDGGGACSLTCPGDTACKPAFYCDGGTSTCVPDDPNGTACTSDSQCTSSFCRDGFCCDAACTGTCESCDQGGSEGTCSPHASGTDPETECGGFFCDGGGSCDSSCVGDGDCKSNFHCDAGTCQPDKGPGEACLGPGECLSGFCTDGFCCESACGGTCESCDQGGSEGTCSPHPSGTDPETECGGFFCDGGGACSSTCPGDTACKPAFYCDSGTSTCVPDDPNGAACTSDSQCTSGFCRDGFCCDTTCGDCQSCNQSSLEGICTDHPASTDPDGDCGAFTCDGSGACRTTCSNDLECAAGNICDAGLCVPGFILTINKVGNGRGDLTTTPSGVDCGDNCTKGFPTSALVTFDAEDGPGSVFHSYGGDPDCADGSVTMTAPVTCTVNFLYIEGPPLRTAVEPGHPGARDLDSYVPVDTHFPLYDSVTLKRGAAAYPGHGDITLKRGILTTAPETMPQTREHILLGRQVGLPSFSQPAATFELHSGELRLGAVDFHIPGVGMDFVFARRYRSRLATTGSVMGHHWDHSYNIFIIQHGTDLELHNGNGRRDHYGLQTGGTWTRPEFFTVIEQQPDTSYHLTFPDTSRYEFSPLDGTPDEGRITAIVDRNGNTISLAYDASGRLITFTDTLSRNITLAYDPNDQIISVTDFAGRQMTYDYYDGVEPGGSLGDLKSTTTPAVTGTPNGNDFPAGKTTVYTYSTGFADEHLNHNLLTITDPKGQIFLTNTYAGTTNPADINYDRLTRTIWGDPGDILDYVYIPQPPNPGNNFATVRTIVNDRVGNVTEYFYDAKGRAVIWQEYTGRANPSIPTTDVVNRPVLKLRAGDPNFFETRFEYNPDSLVTRVLFPNQNEVLREYQVDVNPTVPRFAHPNLLSRTQLPGPLGGDQLQIQESWLYTDGASHPSGAWCFVTQHTDGKTNTTTHLYDASGNRTQTTHRIATIVENFEYDSFGRLTAHVDSSNGSTPAHRRRDEFTYHLTGPQTGYLKERIIDAPGFALTTTYEYDLWGNLIREVDPRGHDTLHVVNALDEEVRVTSREVAATVGPRYERDFSYDANGNIFRVDVRNLDDKGVLQPNIDFTTTYVYDTLNYLVLETREVDPSDNVVTEFEYDGNRNRTLVRFGEATSGSDPDNVVQSIYDERDLLFQAVRAPGASEQSTTRYDYDQNEKVVRVDQGLESLPRIELSIYDGYDRLIQSTDPMGNVSLYNYDPNHNQATLELDGELIDVAGGSGNVRLYEVTYVYDNMDRRVLENVEFFDTNTQAPIGDGLATTTFTYADNSLILDVTDDNGHLTTRRYDTADRLQVETDAKSNTVIYTYDDNSNVISTLEVDKSDLGNPDRPVITGRIYDGLDRPISTTDNVGNVTLHAYDSRGNLTTVTDPRGNIRTFEYDGLNRLTTTTRDLTDTGLGTGILIGQIITAQEWDDTSRQTAIIDGNGNRTEYVYDSLNRVSQIDYQDATIRIFTYDVHDNRTTSADPNGTTVTHTYDLDDRLIQKTVSLGPGVGGTTTETFTYDGLRRVRQADDDDSTVFRSYDSLSRVLQETQQELPAGTSGTVSATYDGVGNLTQLVYPSGRTLLYTYDDLNRVQKIEESPGGAGTSILDTKWFGPHTVERYDYGNGTRYDAVYDGIRRVTGTTHAQVIPPVVFDDRTYAYDASSNKTQATDLLVLPIPEPTTYVYDSINRLRTSQLLGAAPQPPQEYILDNAGNRNLVINGPDPGPYVLDPTPPPPGPADFQKNHYTSTSYDMRSYDENGNLAQTAGVVGPLQSYQYDFKDLPLHLNDAVFGTTADYKYDALGRRILKATGPPLLTTRYFYLGSHVIEEQDDLGATQATYALTPESGAIRFGDGAHGHRLSRGRKTRAFQMIRGGQERYIHQDDLGSVRKITDGTGAVVEQYRYEDYGLPHIFNGAGAPLPVSSVQYPYGFRDGRYDSETWHGFSERSSYGGGGGGRISIDYRSGKIVNDGNPSPAASPLGNSSSAYGNNPVTSFTTVTRPHHDGIMMDGEYHFTATAGIMMDGEYQIIGGRHTPFFKGYRPQFYFRTTDVTGAVKLAEGVEMVMPGDNVTMTVNLIVPVAPEEQVRFAIGDLSRPGGGQHSDQDSSCWVRRRQINQGQVTGGLIVPGPSSFAAGGTCADNNEYYSVLVSLGRPIRPIAPSEPLRSPPLSPPCDRFVWGSWEDSTFCPVPERVLLHGR